MANPIVSIDKVYSAYIRARALHPGHDAACTAAAQALAIPVEFVRDAVARAGEREPA